MNSELEKLRHSTSHLLAAAIVKLYPQAKPTIGPPIKNGFYYDFDNLKISEEDFPKIENEMQKIVKNWKKFERIEVTPQKARQLFRNNEYKIELIKKYSKMGEKITLYKSGEFIDLCKGEHIADPYKNIKHFKLLSVAGAYWQGNEKNKMLTRIYGTAFKTKEELQNYLKFLEEAQERDHRKIGKELKLFLISDDVGSGLVLLTPKGAMIRREIENFIIEEQTKRGYLHVYSPHIGRKSLWQTSGHWDLYKDKMYSSMKIDKEEYLIKPMNCPFHMAIYKSQLRSYKDLPIKIAEIATVYRYEKTGELSGLLRVRHITQDDSHIFCREDQVVDEFIGVFEYTEYLLRVFGIKDYYLRLGLRSPKEKYLGNDKIWKKAEEEIVKAIKKKNLSYIKSQGDAAFYGPKLDILIKDALEREWQCGTIQVDFMLPERFSLSYIDKGGKEKTPVLIHRAPLGSLERFMAILIEHYKGSFPVWLSPVQVKIIPISTRNQNYCQKILQTLKTEKIRAEIDSENKTLSYKIRSAEVEKIPFLIIVGDKEEKSGKVALRQRSGKDLGQLTVDEFIQKIKKEIDSKSIIL